MNLTNKTFSLIAIVALLLLPCASAQNYSQPPNVYATAATGLGLNYSGGLIMQGGKAVIITPSTLTATNTQTDCSAPSFASCNFVFYNTGVALSISTVYATATAPGNVLVAYVTATGGNITAVTFPQSNAQSLTTTTDGYYFVGPQSCSMQLTVGTFAANPGNAGGASAPGFIRAAAGNTVLQLTTTAAANTTTVTCDFTPPTRLTTGRGITINHVAYLFGYQTTALTSIGTWAPTSITYHAASITPQGTVAAIGGALTVNGSIVHGTPPATTTTGQCITEDVTFGTPLALTTDLTRLTWENTFAQSAAAATVMQICGTIVYYSINGV